MERFNRAPADTVEDALLSCYPSPRWARRIAAHRPYPDLESLLAAADEAAYDLTAAELAGALAREAPSPPPGYASAAALTALGAAHAAYESRFGHVFVICLDDAAPDEALDRVLAGIRARLAHDPDEERAVVAEELRRLARGRLARLVGRYAGRDTPDGRRYREDHPGSGDPGHPYVPV
ncbi:2-oxo-4-hydroxy-4-carboxy-5-ureidoimidazoline decarboxylase [Streptomyces minutiscleroticus]|nr:2-oxo-4-hydroxy-4-carboxy-5-ureidoimidazoline decarboxylase [Streptomyces minutiscleroticus]